MRRRPRPHVGAQASAHETYRKPTLQSAGCVAGELLLRQSSLLTDAGGERVDVEITCLKDTEVDPDADTKRPPRSRMN